MFFFFVIFVIFLTSSLQIIFTRASSAACVEGPSLLSVFRHVSSANLTSSIYVRALTNDKAAMLDYKEATHRSAEM